MAGVGGASAATGFAICRAVPALFAPVELSFEVKELLSSGDFSLDVGRKFLDLRGLGGGAAYRLLVEEVMEAIERLAACPSAAYAGQLSGNLQATESSPPRSCRSDVRAQVRHLVALDFERGELCDVDGWQLSLTECRLAGLAFLFRQQGGYVAQPLPSSGDPLEPLPNWRVTEVGHWGPRSSLVNEPFNVQSDGYSALWFHVDEIDRYAYKIYVGSFAARTVVNTKAKLISASLAPQHTQQVVSKAGEVAVHLVDPARGKQLIGHFSVRSRGRALR